MTGFCKGDEISDCVKEYNYLASSMETFPFIRDQTLRNVRLHYLSYACVTEVAVLDIRIKPRKVRVAVRSSLYQPA
jgi:hypothetical protein